MVGIAGEDDLDDPDLTSDTLESQKNANVSLAPKSSAGAVPVRPSQSRNGSHNSEPFCEKPGVKLN